MASSNRHWPSMFKSKPCNTHHRHHHHHQWQHDINTSSLTSSGNHGSPYASVPGCEERSPEPKSRWNPKPEQIRILEAIFNSGMVNPPRDEIKKIRAQLQEYGQVGDANVFYWFQNRKSRSKHKLRNLLNSKQIQNTSSQQPQQQQYSPHQISPITTATNSITTSSSCSSEKSSPRGSKRALSSNSPTGSVSKTYFQVHDEFLPAEPPFFLPVQQTGGDQGEAGATFTQGFCFSAPSNVVQVQDRLIGPCTSLLLSEILNNSSKEEERHDQHDQEKNIKMLQSSQFSYAVTSPIGLAPPLPPSTISTPTVAGSTTLPYPVNQLQGEAEPGRPVVSGTAARSTVFIDDVAFDLAVGPFNVREAFGDDAALVDSSGQPVLTNEWGVTLQPLHHGAFYYLVPLSTIEHT